MRKGRSFPANVRVEKMFSRQTFYAGENQWVGKDKKKCCQDGKNLYNWGTGHADTRGSRSGPMLTYISTVESTG